MFNRQFLNFLLILAVLLITLLLFECLHIALLITILRLIHTFVDHSLLHMGHVQVPKLSFPIHLNLSYLR